MNRPESRSRRNTGSDDLQLKKLTEKFESMNDQELQSFFSEMSEDNILTLQNDLEKQLQSLEAEPLPLNCPVTSAMKPKMACHESEIDLKRESSCDISFEYESQTDARPNCPAEDSINMNTFGAAPSCPDMASAPMKKNHANTIFRFAKYAGIFVLLSSIGVLFWNRKLIIEYVLNNILAHIQTGIGFPSVPTTEKWNVFSLLMLFILLPYLAAGVLILKSGIHLLWKQIKKMHIRKTNYELELTKMRRMFEEEKLRNEMLRQQIEQEHNQVSRYQQETEKNAEILIRVLNVIGISKEKMDKILLMAEMIEDADEAEADHIADHIAALISEEKEKILYQKKNEFLSQVFMNDYLKLSDESRNFLITALMIFDRFKDQDKCDFSSICILISKSVELEVKNRYFYRFLDYLGDTRGNCYSKWPESMLQQYGSPKSICMMGDFRFIMGMNNGKNHTSNQAVFISFLKERRILIGDFNTDQKIIELLTEQNAIIENIRLNYRNPAAHTEYFDMDTAKTCIGQVLTEDRYLIRLLSCWSS